MRRFLALGAATMLVVPAGVAAQERAEALASACPANGAYIAASRIGPMGAGADSAGLRLQAPFDTTVTFAFAERRWTWPALWAVVAVGVQGTVPVASGTDAAPWRACAGAAVTMEDATLVLRGASGRVRLRADLSALRRPGAAAEAGRP